MSNVDSSPIVRNCTFRNNHGESAHGTSASLGGGMQNFRSSPTVTNCRFIDNISANGGGIANIESDPTLSYCLFAGNHVAVLGSIGSGAAMYNLSRSTSAAPQIVNCTFAQNYVDNYFHRDVDMETIRNVANCSPVLSNCILWNEDNNIEIANIRDFQQPDSSELPSPVVTYSSVRYGYIGEENIDENPLFVNPENGDFRLQPGSPCINAGESGVDMGAFQFGDVTNDHEVDAVDVQMTINCALGLRTSSETDIDGDGSTDAIDIQLVIDAVLGMK